MPQHYILSSLLAEFEDNLRDPILRERMLRHITIEIETRRIEWLMTNRLFLEIEAYADHPARNMYFLVYPDGKFHCANQYRSFSVLAATRFSANEIAFTALPKKNHGGDLSISTTPIPMRDALSDYLKSLRRMINLLRLARCNYKAEVDETNNSGEN